jgi:hypothetical protein
VAAKQVEEEQRHPALLELMCTLARDADARLTHLAGVMAQMMQHSVLAERCNIAGMPKQIEEFARQTVVLLDAVAAGTSTTTNVPQPAGQPRLRGEDRRKGRGSWRDEGG